MIAVRYPEGAFMAHAVLTEVNATAAILLGDYAYEIDVVRDAARTGESLRFSETAWIEPNELRQVLDELT